MANRFARHARPGEVVLVATIAAIGLVTACSSDTAIGPASNSSDAMAGMESMAHSASRTAPSSAIPSDPAARPSIPLRAHERYLTVGLSQPYTPHADEGTDDYRCFLIDPKLTQDVFLTGVTFEPDQAKEVHHAILYRVEPGQVAAAVRKDADTPTQGWTCFGGAGMSVSPTGRGATDAVAQLESAPWLSAWAPGGKEQVYAPGIGVSMKARSQIILQVHYNLRAGASADQTHVRLRLAPGADRLTPLETMLLPAPVELPCAPGESGVLCERSESILDLTRRFGSTAGWTVAGLQLLCGGNIVAPKASATQSCDRPVDSAVTIQAAAGHMHLLGQSLLITLDPDTDHARTVLDIPVWDFDNQGARPLAAPITVKPGHTIRISCTHDATLRQKLPALKTLPPRYVTWGDGSADEMCLGVLLVTKA